MRRTVAIAVVSGALLLACVLWPRSRPQAPSSGEAEPASAEVAKEQPLPVSRPVTDAALPQPPETQPGTNLLLRLYRGEQMPPLRLEQVAAYLEANHRGVES